MTMVPEHDNKAEKSLSSSDVIAIIKSQHIVLLICLWRYWCIQTYYIASHTNAKNTVMYRI